MMRRISFDPPSLEVITSLRHLQRQGNDPNSSGSAPLAMVRQVIVILLAGAALLVLAILFTYLAMMLLDRCCCSCIVNRRNQNVSASVALNRLTLQERIQVLENLFAGTIRTFDETNIASTTGEEEEAEQNVTCCICLNEYKVGDQILTAACTHQFHKDCCLEWFANHLECPYCRSKLKMTSVEARRAAVEVLGHQRVIELGLWMEAQTDEPNSTGNELERTTDSTEVNV